MSAVGHARVCPNCAGEVPGQFCPTCGIDLDASAERPWAEEPDPAVLVPAAPESVRTRRSRGPLFVLMGVVGVPLVLSALGIGWLNGIGAGMTSPATTTSTTSSPGTAGPTPSASLDDLSLPAPDPGLPDGLFCRDLRARGVGYPDAVTYWQREGAPERMDADRNNIPCETVYPRSEVVDFWGEVGWGSAGGYLATLPSGLYCRDLDARGLDYSQAVAYWLSQGMPDRMDEDIDGMPCESVYGEEAAAAYWDSPG